MKCLICNTNTLSNFELEEMLKGYKCSKCDGCWIKGFQYWKWIKNHGETIPEKSVEFTVDLPVSDSNQAKVCIECGHLMTKNKVGHGIPFEWITAADPRNRAAAVSGLLAKVFVYLIKTGK